MGGQRKQPPPGTAEPAVRGLCAGGQRGRGEHRALGHARRARRRNHDGDIVVDRLAGAQ